MDDQQEYPGLFNDLELAIKAAGTCVHPSDDLRPRTIEVARHEGVLRRGKSRSLYATAAMLLLPVFITASCTVMFGSNRISGVTAQQLQERSEAAIIQGNVTPYWAMVEAFLGMRQDQAKKFNP